MSLLSRSPSESSSSGLPRLPVVLAAARAIARTIAKHRAARRIGELPDYLLTDIGLKRDDVHEMLSADWHDDPAYKLATKAAGHRRRP